jgi:hypothetical protein
MSDQKSESQEPKNSQESQQPAKSIQESQQPNQRPSSIVVKDGAGKHIKKLETKISFLEDENSKQAGIIHDYEEKFKVLSKVPSSNPSKTILDQLDEFLTGEVSKNS